MDDMSEEDIKTLVRHSPPGCIAAFRASRVESLDRSNPSIRPVWHSAEPFMSLWRLRCRCGSRHGKLLGYQLQDYAPDYLGDSMVTPIGFKCGSCSEVTEILDTALHGYHAELAKLEGGGGSAKVSGSGERKVYRCGNCQHQVFDLTLGFAYWHFDIIFDEPELPAQNFFNEFLMLCTCARCGGLSEPVELGKL
jgi:hypothetical protein